jgi:predicted nucleotidyltransferase
MRMKLIDDNLHFIKALCKKHKVKRLFVFGSVLTPRFNSQSDVDLLVDFNKEEVGDYFDNFFNLKYALENLLGKEVDLVEGQTVRNPYLKEEIDQHKVLIYG